MPPNPRPAADLSATVTSKGQITLPRAVRSRLGIHAGSRIRFTLPPGGGFEAHPVLMELEDLWAMADEAGKPRPVMIFDEMNAAKARRPRRRTAKVKLVK
jgi:AbrB family looped-hinge helix DNA binding protein